MPAANFYNDLYLLQDKVLSLVSEAGPGFYLTGGTALGRVYLHHRHSDDLDFFMNNSSDFSTIAENVVRKLKDTFGTDFNLVTVDSSFVRCALQKENIPLKIDMVNDIDYRFGELLQWEKFPAIDHPLNILSNKIAALSRFAEKDVADILYLSYCYSFNWEFLIREGQKKNMWVNPVDVSQIINSFPIEKFDNVFWNISPDTIKALHDLKIIAKEILEGVDNSLFRGA